MARSWPNSLPEGGMIIFTDGSKTSEETGAGVKAQRPEEGKWLNLGSLASVFQAETFAALIGVLKVIPIDAFGKKVTICSD